jgi:DNA-binding CsgD family transcriptional regulator
LRDLVLAVLAQWERRPRDAVAILSTLSSATAAPVDQAWVQHRIEALLGWNLLTTGAAEAAISEALSRAEMYDEFDPTISRLGMLARAQVTARHAFGPDQVPGLDVLPDNPTAVPEQATSLLGWRGVVRANTGQFALAIADLAEMTERMQRGLADFSSGTYHAMLARAQWYAGDWTMARVNFRLAGELAGDLPPPLVLVSAALPAIGVGAADAADKALAVGQDAVDRSPWLEAVDQLFIVEVIRQHAVGAPDPSLHSRIKPALDQIRRSESFKSVVWCLHAGLAALWAKEPDDVALCAERVAGSAVRTEWAEAASAWLRGLALETTGDGKGALAALRIAISRDASAMPLYGAHFHVDHARVAHLMKDLAGAARSLDIAASTYHQLGATSYLNQVDEIRRTTESIRASSALALSDRERDVLALVTAGMSYAQIARDLFITQSTVSYHLGNIYAKANVTSRHQLTELAREDPSMFGLAAPA